MKNKTLYRIPSKGIVSGICAGLAEYFEMDVNVVRLIAVISMFATFSVTFWVYLVALFILPIKK